jgi:predicted transposase YbfD/YdcC
MLHFSVLPDPRKQRNQLYRLHDIVSTAILATLCSIDHYYGMSDWTEDNIKWFQSVGICLAGVPSHDTYERFFKHLDSKAFQLCFMKWTQSIAQAFKGVIAIDGKTLRNSGDDQTDPIHIVSAFAAENSLVLGHQKCAGKGKELEAIQQLLEILDIREAIITIDAAGCHKEITSQIKGRGGDYQIALKGNQEKLHDEVVNFFNQACVVAPEEANCDYWCAEETTRGRNEKREVWSCDHLNWLPQQNSWYGLNSIVCISKTRSEKGQSIKETRYFISSLPANAQRQGKVVRSHWGIENQLHWHLDVTFKEDKSKVRAGNGAENLSLLRRSTLNLLKLDKSTKVSLKNKRLKAGRKPDYLLSLIGVK